MHHIATALFYLCTAFAFYAMLHPTNHPIEGDLMPNKKKESPKPKEATVDSRIVEHVATLLCVQDTDVTPKSKLQEDLGADSLDIVELVVDLEEEFDIIIPDEKAEKFVTVSDVIRYVKKSIEEEAISTAESIH